RDGAPSLIPHADRQLFPPGQAPTAQEGQAGGEQDERHGLWNLLLGRCVRNAEVWIVGCLAWKELEQDEGQGASPGRSVQEQRVGTRHIVDQPQEVEWKAAEDE